MALLKTVIDNKGQASTYHRIVAFSQVYVGENQALSVNLAAYTSAEYRAQDENGNMIVAGTPIVLPLMDAPSRAAIYTAIKALPGWEDAEDC